MEALKPQLLPGHVLGLRSNPNALSKSLSEDPGADVGPSLPADPDRPGKALDGGPPLKLKAGRWRQKVATGYPTTQKLRPHDHGWIQGMHTYLSSFHLPAGMLISSELFGHSRPQSCLLRTSPPLIAGKETGPKLRLP